MLFKKALTAVVICAGVAGVAQPAAAEVQLTMSGGRVTLSAKNATPAQILAEWARVGQTRIVNPERVSGGPMTLELSNVTEVEAIEILLRSAGGYLLAPRRTETANASRYDRILILPPSVAVTSAPRVVSAPAPLPRPTFAPPQPGVPAGQQLSADDNDGPAERPNVANPPVQNPRPPVFNTFPQPPQRTPPLPPAQPAPTSAVTAPVGVAVPGMVVPTPQPAGQPGASQQPQQR